MSVIWIPAAEALSMASDRLGSGDSARALAAGAESGAIATRAARFIVEVPNACGQKARFEDALVELPREFWSSEGRETVAQDWDAGNFLTLVNASFHHEAFGVEFDRTAIEAFVQSAD